MENKRKSITATFLLFLSFQKSTTTTTMYGVGRTRINYLTHTIAFGAFVQIVDPYLETKSSVTAVEDILNGFSKRQVDVTTSLDNWTTQIAEKREVEIILEKIMSDNEEVSGRAYAFFFK